MIKYKIGDAARVSACLDGPRDGDPLRDSVRDALDRLAAGTATVEDAVLVRDYIGGSPAGWAGGEFCGGTFGERAAVRATVKKLNRLIETEQEALR